MPEQNFIEGKFIPLDIFQQIVDLIRENVSHKDSDFLLQVLRNTQVARLQVPLPEKSESELVAEKPKEPEPTK